MELQHLMRALVLAALLSLVAVSVRAASPTAQEKMDLIKSAFDAIREGNAQGFLDVFAEDAVYRLDGGPELPWSGVWEGQDGLLRAIGLYSQYANYTFDNIDFFASPTSGRVVAYYHLKGNSLVTGKPFEEPCFLMFAITDDLKVVETIETCNALKEYKILIQTSTEEKGEREKWGGEKPTTL